VPAVNIRSPCVYLACSLPDPRSQIGESIQAAGRRGFAPREPPMVPASSTAADRTLAPARFGAAFGECWPVRPGRCGSPPGGRFQGEPAGLLGTTIRPAGRIPTAQQPARLIVLSAPRRRSLRRLGT
jgi:hypothetical protein